MALSTRKKHLQEVGVGAGVLQGRPSDLSSPMGPLEAPSPGFHLGLPQQPVLCSNSVVSKPNSTGAACAPPPTSHQCCQDLKGQGRLFQKVSG